MISIKIIKAKNYDDMSIEAAEIIAAQIAANPASVLGLATGSTPIGLYERLAVLYNEGKLDFSGVITFNLDEYCGLGKEHPQSYGYYMRENLFDKVNIDPKNAHIPNGIAADTEAECRRFDKLIESFGGVDLQLLGIGHDGHIGFNEPDDVFGKGSRCVKLAQSTIAVNSRFFANPDDMPRRALTVGIDTIMNAKKILLVVNGQTKRDILEECLFGDITPQVPASILQLHPDVVVVTDCEI
jgi:glucosamine-6-phosphate deaminase